MSTSAGFTPPADAACYNPRMTRAAALALRAASGLRENCVVVITDGPSIGVAGSPGGVSTTEIELQPQSPTDLGFAALVHTAYDGAAWGGRYDIDLGTGTIVELRDNTGNVVVDRSGVTIQTQFPWGAPNVRDNSIFGQADLLNWGPVAGTSAGIVSNYIDGGENLTTVDLSGLGGLQFINNRVSGALVFIKGSAGTAVNAGYFSNIWRDNFVYRQNSTSPGTVFVDGNDFHDRNSANAGDDFVYNGTGGLNLDGNTIRAFNGSVMYQFGGSGPVALQGNILNDARITKTGAASLDMINNELDGTTGGAFQFSALAGSTLFISNRLALSSLVLDGTSGALNIRHNRGSGVTLSRPVAATNAWTILANQGDGWTLTQAAGVAAGTVSVTNNFIQLGTYTKAGTGGLTLTDNTLNGVTVNLSAGSTGSANLGANQLTEGTYTIANSGGITALNGNQGRFTVTNNGTGTASMFQCVGSGSLTHSAASTRATQLNSLTMGRGVVNQNGTGAAAQDAITGGSILGDSVMNWNNTNGAANGAGRPDMNGFAQVTITDGSGPNCMQNVKLDTEAQLFIQSGATVASGIYSNRSVTNTGAFTLTGVIIDQPGTRTATATQANTTVTKAFADFV